MTELISLGFNHSWPNYKPTYDLLNKLHPNLITLELSVLQPQPYMFETYLFEKRQESELEAGYIFAKENNLPLYAIDSQKTIYNSDLKEIQLKPKDVIKYNFTEIKDPLKLFPKYWDYFAPQKYTCKTNNLQKRNEFMAQTLDLLAQFYPESLIIHIGGAHHVIPTNSENAAPVHKLTKQFDEISGRLLFQNRFTDEYFWVDRIDKKIKKMLKRGKVWDPFTDYNDHIKKYYIF